MHFSRDELRILSELQNNARLTNTELAERIGISTSACWRKTRSLEENNIIAGYHAELNRNQIGLDVMAYVSIRIDTHTDKQSSLFASTVAAYPEVIACHSVAGSYDFMLQVVAKNLDAYEEFAMKKLRKLPGIKEITTNFVLREVKPRGALPVNG